MSSNNIRSGRQQTSDTSGNRNKPKSTEDKNVPITRKRTESPRGGKEKVNLPTRKGSASKRLAPSSETIASQAVILLGSNTGVVTVGRTRTPPNVLEIYGTLGQVVVNRLYCSMLEYNSRHCKPAALSFVPKQPRTFDLHCDKTIASEVRREILPRGSELECFVIKEIEGLGLKDNHYTFQLEEQSSTVKLPRVLELSQSKRDELGRATVNQLIWLSKQPKIIYLMDYFSINGREFDPNTYKKQVKKNGCRIVESYGIESGYISKDTASDDLVTAFRSILPSESETLILDCSLAIVLAFVLAYNQVLGPKKLWSLLHESDSRKSPKQRIRITFDSVDFMTWTQCNYIRSSTWKWNVGDLVYIQGPRYGFAFKPTSVSNGFNALVSNTAPLRFRSFRSYGQMDMDKSLEEYRDAMMKAFKKPLSHRDISDIWHNLQEHPTDLCGAGKSPITWNEVWVSLEGAYRKGILEEAVDAALKACNIGGHTPKRNSTPEILVPPQYCEQYVGLTTVQRMYPDNVLFK
ncbi:uncharacterized protein EAE97_000237 [Botrytis byssoidea]|uniref:Uncharacterized protein n=1 Tax=Botrytis byssoidea TaxID=139641 RepID=A0A9P5IYJ4_9HELO|nr:uncharacterized protein EAE97_000237 [Botrytis byssoidea]KAF7954978.1 hypothetical protein EAE97_000237 [Botrytis byssoidea]